MWGHVRGREKPALDMGCFHSSQTGDRQVLQGVEGGPWAEPLGNSREWRRAGKGWILRLKMYDKPVCNVRICTVNLKNVNGPGKANARLISCVEDASDH